MITFRAELTGYTLPDDGPQAHADFLELLHSPGETWLFAYNLSDPGLIAEILAADAAGVVVHCLLDRTQSTGPSERDLLAKLRAGLKRGDVTITTAGVGSKSTGEIWHYKALVTLDGANEPWCWEGSCNFSETGWLQGNSAFKFRSAPWAEAIQRIYAEHRAWALKAHPEWQAPPAVAAHS